MPSIMIQGCGSDVGKTVLVAGLCRLLANRGLTVRPFKPQNMSNNAAVTLEGGEIGRSTALQALACRVPATVDMNPILLKPESDQRAQLILRGIRTGTFPAQSHVVDKRSLLNVALDSFLKLKGEAEWIVVEGAGSPAETNLRATDIANMGFAHAADLPVVMVGDINRGHVIAALVGAHAVLDALDRDRIRGFIINKFRGDIRLFDGGLASIVQHTGWASLGIVPWLPDFASLPAEDAVQIEEYKNSRRKVGQKVSISVVHLPHISNFDDFDPLRNEQGVDLRFIEPTDLLPLETDLLVIPGTKATIPDLAYLRECGWHHDLHAYLRRGGRLLGVCGGFQMLGKRIRDPERIESNVESIEGFGCFEFEIVMTRDKVLREVSGVDCAKGVPIRGYEMHLGRMSETGTLAPMIKFEDGSTDGAVADHGRILGCHVHGLFHGSEFRRSFLASLSVSSHLDDYNQLLDARLDAIAESLARVLDIRAIEHIASGH